MDAPRFFRYLAVLAVMGQLGTQGAGAQAACPAGTVAYAEELAVLVFEPAMASQEQVTAPSSSEASVALVDRPSFPSLFAMALESSMATPQGGALTLDINPFALKAMVMPSHLFDQSKYEQPMNRLLRKWGGALVVGGQGESFDRDGDGQVDEALEAVELDDIVNWEVRFRLSKSRESREAYNTEKIAASIRDSQLALSNLESQFLQRRGPSIRQIDPDGDGCIEQAAWEAFVNLPEVQLTLSELAEATKTTLKDLADVVAKVRQRPLWTVAVGGISREEQFGPNSYRIALRGAVGNHTFNAEGVEIQTPDGRGDDPRTYKLAYAYSRVVGRRLVVQGMDLSAGAAYEIFDNVPAALHDTNVKANVRLDYPLTKAIKVPISVTWANHKDLLTDQDEVRGHVGFAINFSQLLNPGG